MSDTGDMAKVIELWADQGGCDVTCEVHDIIEIVNDQLKPVAWVGRAIHPNDGNC